MHLHSSTNSVQTPAWVHFGTSQAMSRRLNDCKSTSPLLKFAKNNTSQHGEDGIIAEILRRIGTAEYPFCVDIGAWDGKHLSNTYSLLKESGWRGILFEANSIRADELRLLYSDRCNDIRCIEALVQISGQASLACFLDENNAPIEFDFLSIDIDGADYHIWKSLGNQKYLPRLVCIEFNPSITNDVYFIQEPDFRIQQGSSLLAITDLGKSLGYTLAVTTTFNAFFVRNDLLPLLQLTNFDNNLYNLNPESMCTKMFQTYNGEIRLVGPRKLLWHGTAVNPQQFQVLAKKDRKFPFAPPSDDNISISTLYQHFAHFLKLLAGAKSSRSHDSLPGLSASLTALLRLMRDLLPVPQLESLVLSLISALSGVDGLSDFTVTITVTVTAAGEEAAGKELLLLPWDTMLSSESQVWLSFTDLQGHSVTESETECESDRVVWRLADSVLMCVSDILSSRASAVDTLTADYGHAQELYTTALSLLPELHKHATAAASTATDDQLCVAVTRRSANIMISLARVCRIQENLPTACHWARLATQACCSLSQGTEDAANNDTDSQNQRHKELCDIVKKEYNKCSRAFTTDTMSTINTCLSYAGGVDRLYL